MRCWVGLPPFLNSVEETLILQDIYTMSPEEWLMIRTKKKFSSEQERIKDEQQRLQEQQGAADFGGAFWLLTTETSGKKFMAHPGYKYDMEKQEDVDKVLRRMHEHIRDWGKKVNEWNPGVKLKLYVSGEAWKKGRVWTETDTLVCRGLEEVNDFLKKALA